MTQVRGQLIHFRPLTACAISVEASRQAFQRQAKRPSLPSIPEESSSDGTRTINLLTVNSNAMWEQEFSFFLL
jgi:hypothetical protein